MRHTLFFALVLTCAVLLGACTSGAGPASYVTPEDTAKSFFKAVQAKDMTAINLCLARASQEVFTMPPGEQPEILQWELINWEILGIEKKSAYRCRVNASVTKKQAGKEHTETMPLPMGMEDGLWKIDYGIFSEDPETENPKQKPGDAPRDAPLKNAPK